VCVKAERINHEMTVHVVDSVDLQLARDIEHDPFEAFEAQRRISILSGQKEGDFYEGGFWVIGKFGSVPRDAAGRGDVPI